MNIEKISEVKTGSYFLRVSDIIDLLNSTDNDAFMAMNLAYNYEFSRGQRAGKARAKKKAVKS